MEKAAFYHPADVNTGPLDFEEERRYLEKENAALKQELATLGVFSDTSFLPLKVESDNGNTYSTEAMANSSTLTSLSSTSSSYTQLPGRQKVIPTRDVTQSKAHSLAESNAKKVSTKPDYLQKYSGLRLRGDTKGDSTPNRHLSEGALSSDIFSNEKLSTTPQRFYEPGRQIEIGRIHKTRTGQSDGTIGQSLQQQPTETGSTISKKLIFYGSSEDELEEIEKSAKHCQKGGLLGKKDKNWKKRVVGEIAFQLDRRILQYVFYHRRRLYGFTVRNISEKIEETGIDECTGCDSGTVKMTDLRSRRDNLFEMLREKAEYDPRYHPLFSELMVNKYGILKVGPWDAKEELKALENLDFLTRIVTENVDSEYRKDAVILLRSLNVIAARDHKPVLMW